MSGEKKTEIIKDFTEGKINLLVSTTVIEVGIDVPDATLIVIERAERFGLSQIHQLRGRVGRREKEGKCILVIPDNLSENSENRIRILEKESDGFKIAEYDLEIRGPGDILGNSSARIFRFKSRSSKRYETHISCKRNSKKSCIWRFETRRGKNFHQNL
jgi:ATP-dependent DNA helicase RecG